MDIAANAKANDEHLARLAMALDMLPWGIFTVDLRGDAPVVVFANARTAALLGASTDGLVGTDARLLFEREGLAGEAGALLRGPVPASHEVEVRRGGNVRWHNFHFIPDVAHGFCFVVVADATDAKIREGQYFQAQRLEALGQLAAGIAHDFNNILSIIDGYARMARRTLDPRDEAAGHVEHIASAVQRGSSLTGQLLAFGRYKASKNIVIDLGRIVEDQASLLRPLMDASISLSFIAPPGIMVEAPPDHVCQILMNLCVNARDAMPDGGALRVEVALQEERAVLEVRDSGTGIPPDIQPMIFDPFFTTKDHGEGTGLGLSTVYGLVQEMGGTIEVTSAAGAGTAVRISLPLAAPLAAGTQPMPVGERLPTLEGLTALVAEDEPDLLNIVSTMMEDLGAIVLKAANGQQALDIQRDYDGEIDVLLTDVVMPEMNGVKLAALFEERRPDSRVMFMSGYPGSGQLARVEVPQDALLMPKPVDFPSLCRAVRTMSDGRGDATPDKTGRKPRTRTRRPA